MKRQSMDDVRLSTGSTQQARKPTAAEYTEKRIQEVADMLAAEIDRIQGQYNRLRAHFGIPPLPEDPSQGQQGLKDSGMEYQINRLHGQLQVLMEIVTKTNELI